MNRQSLDSKSLQEKFKSTYELFFQSNKLVVSSNFLFPWSPIGVGHRSKCIRIKSKLPLKMYMGINQIQEYDITINKVINYNLHNDNFENIEFGDIHKKKLEIINFIKGELDKNGFSGGLQISILSEGTRGHGLGFTGCFASCIAMSIYILLGKLNPSDLIDYEKFLKSKIYNELFLIARKIDFISRDGNSNGDNSYFSFLNTKLPMISFSEKFHRDMSLSQLDKVKVFCQPFDKFFKNTLLSTEIPLDYALVFSGMKNDSSKIEQFTITDEHRINSLDKFINKSFKDFNGNFGFKEYLNDQINFSTYDVYVETFSRLNFELLKLFKNLFNNGFSNSDSLDFINQLNKFTNFLSIIESGNKFGVDFQHQFKKHCPDGIVGIMPIYSGKIGGGYIVVMRYMQDRTNFENVVEQMKKYYPNICLDYASWIDNDNYDGVQVLQNISYGHYSDFISKESVVCKSSHGKIEIGDHLNLQFKYSNSLLLDNIEKKIYLNGRKLTSDDLFSQSSTVELMTYFLKNLGRSIKNTELPVSSYSKNKNDMLGKIILPFVKFVKSTTGEELNILCQGGLTEFVVKLDQPTFEIFVISKL